MQERFISHISVDSFGYSLLRESERGGRGEEKSCRFFNYRFLSGAPRSGAIENNNDDRRRFSKKKKKCEMSGSLILELLFTVLKHSAAPFGVSRSRLMTALFGKGGFAVWHCEDKR